MNEPVDKLTFSCDLIFEQQKRIAELEKFNKFQSEVVANADIEIAELEKERDELNEKFEEYFDAFMNCKCIPRDMEARNLEQKAKGIQSVIDDEVVSDDGYISIEYLKDCADDFNSQAKQLREGVK